MRGRPNHEANARGGLIGSCRRAARGGTTQDGRAPHLTFLGDSDAHIVRGLVALTLAIFSGQTADAILKADAHAVFERLGLGAHLTPQRSNGLRSMVERIKSDARAALQAA